MIYVHQSIPVTQIQIAFGAGAWQDPPGLEGLASLAMDLLLTGTQRYSRRALESRIDALGAHVAASASADYCIFSLEVLSDKLEPALDLVEEMLLRPSLDAAEFERLRRQERQEIIADQDDDRAVGSRLFRQFLFRYAGYGRPTSGTLASLDRLEPDHARQFVTTELAQAPVILGVASDLPPERLVEGLEQRLPFRWTDEPLTGRPENGIGQAGLRVLLIDKPERTQCQVFLGTAGPWGAAVEDYAPLRVATTVLGGSFTSRLTHEVREKRGLSYGAACYIKSMRRGGLFKVRLSPARERVHEAIAVVRRVVDEWLKDGITDDETAFARQYLENQFHFRIETPGMELYQKMINLLVGRPQGFLDGYLKAIGSVTREQAGEAVKRWFSGAPWTIAVVATVDADVEAAFREALRPQQLKVVPYTEELIP